MKDKRLKGIDPAVMIRHILLFSFFIFHFSSAFGQDKVKYPQSFTPQAQKTLRDTIDTRAAAIALDSAIAVWLDSVKVLEARMRVDWLQSITDSLTNIPDSKLSQITTANKVAGSAVQLNATGGITNSTGLKITPDGSTLELNSNTLRMKDAGVSWNKLDTATKDSIRLYSAGTLNVTNNADDTTTVEIGNQIKIKDQTLRYPVMTKFNTGKAASATYNQIANAFKKATFVGFDTTLYYKLRNPYRNNVTLGYKVYLDTVTKGNSTWGNYTSTISTSTVNENSEGITHLVVTYGTNGALGTATFEINYNEFPTGTSFNLTAAGDMIFNESLFTPIDSVASDFVELVPGQTWDYEYKILVDQIKDIKFYGFDDSYWYKIRNFYINYTGLYNVIFEYKKRDGTGDWHTLRADSMNLDTVSTTSTTNIIGYYPYGRQVHFEVDYRNLKAGPSAYYFPTTTGQYVFKKTCFINNNRKDVQFGGLDMAYGLRKQLNQSAVNVYSGIRKKQGLPFLVKGGGEVHKKTHDVNKNRKYVAVGWNYLFPEDYEITAPILLKYGATNYFNMPESYADDNWETPTYSKYGIQKIANGGNDMGAHSLMHYIPLWLFPEYDGYNFPSNYNLRHDYGSNLNLLGLELDTPPSDEIANTYWYDGNGSLWYDNNFEDLTDGQCDTLRMSMSIFRVPITYNADARGLESLDYLSNKYLGTTGYGRIPVGGLTTPTLDEYGYPTYTDSANWNVDSTQIQGGIFQGCSTTQNHEIWERLLQIERAWNLDHNQVALDETHFPMSGGWTQNMLYHSGSVAFFDSSLSDTASLYTDLISTIDTTSRSMYDVLKAYGFKSVAGKGYSTGASDGRTILQYNYPFKINSKAMGKTEDLDFDVIAADRHLINVNYFSTAEWDSIAAQDSVLQWMYDRDKAAAQNKGFYQNVRDIVKYTAWGLIPYFVDDAAEGSATQEANLAVWVELRSQFCYLAGIQEIGFGEANDLCFNQTVNGDVNYFPNPDFDKTIEKVIHSTTNPQTIPDGWSGGTSAYNDTIGYNVLTVTSGSTRYIRQYFLQPGDAHFTFKGQGNGKIKLYYLKNSDPQTIATEPTTIDYDSVNVASSGTWTDYSLDINIPVVPDITSPDSTIACQGRDNQICGLHIVLKGIGGNVRIAKPIIKRY